MQLWTGYWTNIHDFRGFIEILACQVLIMQRKNREQIASVDIIARLQIFAQKI